MYLIQQNIIYLLILFFSLILFSATINTNIIENIENKEVKNKEAKNKEAKDKATKSDNDFKTKNGQKATDAHNKSKNLVKDNTSEIINHTKN